MPGENDPDHKISPKVEILNRPEEERLRRDIYRPDLEKLHLFTQMLRINTLYKEAKVKHK